MATKRRSTWALYTERAKQSGALSLSMTRAKWRRNCRTQKRTTWCAVAVDRRPNGPFYAGLGDCTVQIDRKARRGFKNMAEHMNQMDAAMKRKVKIKFLDNRAKRALKQLLIDHSQEMWNNTPKRQKRHWKVKRERFVKKETNRLSRDTALSVKLNGITTYARTPRGQVHQHLPSGLSAFITARGLGTVQMNPI